ncbi:unnamed protein product [Acanthoscelides obtectus]|uniref:Uncharacterized protein n=1 Tax=Acanthoscelides obtectus TaxID=200917 RepID=A0A9P0P1X9_ACAOB|nr:unnamed protein product [Acanthoscelides obtectus]CAK1658728.1 hypothetical protein AOBTE_LOCUS21089 [Acanthoscelides obtectus]
MFARHLSGLYKFGRIPLPSGSFTKSSLKASSRRLSDFSASVCRWPLGSRICGEETLEFRVDLKYLNNFFSSFDDTRFCS